jgi:hypothetical protein
MTGQDGFMFGLFTGLGMGMALLPILYLVVWQPLGKFWRGWRLRIQTSDDFEKAVRREVDKRWLGLEAERRLRIINLEVQERLARRPGDDSPASRKRP